MTVINKQSNKVLRDAITRMNLFEILPWLPWFSVVWNSCDSPSAFNNLSSISVMFCHRKATVENFKLYTKMEGSWTVESLSKLAEFITRKLLYFSRCLHVDGEIRREVLGRVPWIAPLHSTGSLIPQENFWMLCKIMFLLENTSSKLNLRWYFFVYAGYFMFHNGFVPNFQCPTPRVKFGGKAGKCFPSWQKLTRCAFLMSLACTSKNSSRYQWHRKVYFKMPLHSLFLRWKSVSTKMSMNAFGKGIHGFDVSARRCALGSLRRLVISCRGGLSKQSCSQFIQSASEYYPKDPGNSIT